MLVHTKVKMQFFVSHCCLTVCIDCCCDMHLSQFLVITVCIYQVSHALLYTMAPKVMYKVCNTSYALYLHTCA